MSLERELLAAGVPVSVAARGRIAMAGPYKTATGQWVVAANGSTLFVGSGDPPPPPNAAMLANVANVKGAHVPPPPRVYVNGPLWQRAVTKAALGEVLTARETAELEKAKRLP